MVYAPRFWSGSSVHSCERGVRASCFDDMGIVRRSFAPANAPSNPRIDHSFRYNINVWRITRFPFPSPPAYPVCSAYIAPSSFSFCPYSPPRTQRHRQSTTVCSSARPRHSRRPGQRRSIISSDLPRTTLRGHSLR